MNQNTKVVITIVGVALLSVIYLLAVTVINDSQKIGMLTAENQSQSVAEEASSTQEQENLVQQQTCGSLKVEFASECSQTEQQNENQMTQDIENCVNSGSGSVNTCAQNFANDFKDSTGVQFLVNCENLKLAANSCPILKSTLGQ